MRDLKGHLVLFAAAAVAALLTWNLGEVGEASIDLALAWKHDTTDFRSIHYRSPHLDLRIERRTDREGPFYWGIQTRGDEPAGPLEFPVGWSGAEIVPNLTALQVLRDLGALSPEQRARYGFADSEARLTVEFSDERRQLVVGDSVFGSEDRYVLDTATGRGYVISRHIVNPIEIGEGAIRERMVHNFRSDRVAAVRVTAGAGGERTMVPAESGEWVEPGGDTPDLGFGNFMERVDGLAIEGYDNLPPADRLRLLLRVDYLDEDGGALGFMELLRDDLAERNAHYLRSESTRIVARAHTTLAERVEQAVGDIF